jgi:alpha-mannosidase
MSFTHETRYTAGKIARRLELLAGLVHRRRTPLSPLRYLPLDGPHIPPPLTADPSAWPEIAPDSYWGAQYQNFALAGVFTIPADFAPELPVMLHLPIGTSGDFSHPEALAYVDGQPLAACDRHHQEVLLRDDWRDGRPHRLLLHGWCGLLGGTSAPSGQQLYMGQPALVQPDPALRQFLALARVALGVATSTDALNPARDRLLNALDDAFRRIDLREPFGEALYASIPAAQVVLEAGIAQAGPPLDAHVHAVGHAHIDTAWLWTLDQTRRKAERTFSTVLRLMEEFPEYRFIQSQPQLYAFLKQDQPELFAQVQQRVAEGRWEPLGGMWVESDCNIPGGESLVRQFLLGRRFFREHFGPGAESPVLWLPDVFGYAWNLPQLIRQAGLEYFFTIKIGWNQVNRLPYDTFWWQGLDGTRVLTHFSTTPEAHDIHSHATYNVDANGMTAVGTWLNVQQKHIVRDILMSYGYGDGGGGPTREMIENIRALDHMPGAPVVRPARVIDFFRHVERTTGDRLPVWNGELYLEIHRGTYTTQARNKRGNRQSEFLLHDAEFAATCASLLDARFGYPHDRLDRAWERVCLNQFHDIIPGSSIAEVYVDSARDYAEIRRLAEGVRDEALEAIAARLGAQALVVNPAGCARVEMLHGADGALRAVQLAPYSIQPPAALQPPDAVGEAGQFAPVSASARHLENALLRVELSDDGDIARLFDKRAQREVLPPGALANRWMACEDRPLNWDAWDIDIFHDEKVYAPDPAQAITLVESDPLRATLEIRRRILSSEFVQRITLEAGSSTLLFDTHIDWRERHILLKAAFPVDVLATSASYEVQFGVVERPTHTNTSWDWARFETAAQKWAHLGEGGFGVGLINDCKYGHRIHEGVMFLSLLRSPTSPDPTADQGEHHFRYGLVIGADTAHTSAEAYRLNDPVIVWQAAQAPTGRADSPTPEPLVQTSAAHVRLETIKRAEDGRGIIVRGYEFMRRRGPVQLQFGVDVAEAVRTSILEEDDAPLAVEDGRTVTLHVQPFQIFSVRIIPRAEAGEGPGRQS